MGSYTIDNGVVLLGEVRLEVPDTVSPEARAYLSSHPWGEDAQDAPRVPMWLTRDAVESAFRMLNEMALQIWPCTVEESEIADVRCHRIRKSDAPRTRDGKVMINLHG